MIYIDLLIVCTSSCLFFSDILQLSHLSLFILSSIITRIKRPKTGGTYQLFLSGYNCKVNFFESGPPFDSFIFVLWTAHLQDVGKAIWHMIDFSLVLIKLAIYCNLKKSLTDAKEWFWPAYSIIFVQILQISISRAKWKRNITNN